MILLIIINQNILLIGGVCLYTNKKFMTDWYHLYLEQQMGIFRPNMIFPWDKLSPFDQTTLWWLLKRKKI